MYTVRFKYPDGIYSSRQFPSLADACSFAQLKPYSADVVLIMPGGEVFVRDGLGWQVRQSRVMGVAA